MIDLAWMRDVLLFVPAIISAWRLGWARSYQIRGARMFESLSVTEQARLNSAGDLDGDWSALSEKALKVRDFRDKATTLTTFSRLLPTWCLASLVIGLLLQFWFIATALVGDGVAAPPQ